MERIEQVAQPLGTVTAPLPRLSVEPPAPPPTEADGPPPRFYRIDSSRASFAELWWDTGVLAVLYWPIELLGVPLPGSVSDPNVLSLAEFEVAADALPPEVLTKLQPLVAELQTLGFATQAAHQLIDAFHRSRLYIVTLLHVDGETIARVHHRVEVSRPHLHCDLLSQRTDGTFLWTNGARSALLAPPTCQIQRARGAGIHELLRLHRGAAASGPALIAVPSRHQLLDLLESHHATVRGFHLQRGLFRPFRPAEAREAELLHGAAARAPAGGRLPLVFAELERLQRRRTGGWSSAALLVGSLVLFVSAGWAHWDLQFALMLVPMLLLHELGHLVAMKAFGYSNVRMFFIPLLGAAVSGQHYNVAGWKKAVVALMGPVPGIILGALLASVGVAMRSDGILLASLICLILNGLNLIPVLPFDGGRIMQALIFSRHVWLEFAARVVAAVALLLLGLVLDQRVLWILALLMLAGIPLAWRIASVIQQLRRDGLRPASPDAKTIPTDAADLIVRRLMAALPAKSGPKSLASATLVVFESLNARPPGLGATLGLGAAYVAGILIAAFFVMLTFVANHTDLGGLARMTAAQPAYSMETDELSSAIWTGPNARFDEPRSTVVATLPDLAAARHRFETLTGSLPPTAAARMIGHSLLVSVPVSSAATDGLFEELSLADRQAFIDSADNTAVLSLMWIAPSPASAERIEQALEEYFQRPGQTAVLPPWSPDPVPPPARPDHRLARTTLKRVLEAAASADPGMLGEINLASRRGDGARYRELTESLDARYHQTQRQAIEALLEEPPDEVDARVVRAYLDHVHVHDGGNSSFQADRRAEADAIEQHLGPLLGAVPPGPDGQLPPLVQRYLTWQGWVSREGQLCQLRGLQVADAYHGPAALIDWLRRQGCGGFRYELTRGQFVYELTVPRYYPDD